MLVNNSSASADKISLRERSASRSGIGNLRVPIAFALFSFGILLGVFSFAATPPLETSHGATNVPADPASFLSTSGSNANALPPGVPLPPGAQFSPNALGDPSRSNPTAGFPGLRPGTASGANSLGNPVLANQQPASLSVPQPAASESMPLASGAASDWSIVDSPNPPHTRTHNLPSGVTCVSAVDCWVVGYYFNGSVYQTLIQHWDGTSWAIVSSPNTLTTQSNFLLGVTCVSASDCWAVGYYNAGSAESTLIEHWDGTVWAIVSSPNRLAAQSNYLLGVTCVSGTAECWAVGYSYTGTTSTYQTLIERWDGTGWAIVSSPNTGTPQTENNILSSVTCVSAADCWAVGYSYGSSYGSARQTLIERWDETSWTIVSSPNTSTTQVHFLLGVACVSASDCWAVGYYFNGITSTYQTLIERWDGTSWAIVTSPNTLDGQRNFLVNVTCVSASNCWAVGYSYNGLTATNQTLIERWDGTSWAIVSSPNTLITQNNFLLGVTCVSASACWAVGSYTGSEKQALIEHWDGTTWAIVSSPNTLAAESNFLLDVTCVSASECWAVGYYFNGTVEQTLIERWDGTSWTIVSSPNTLITQVNFLRSVTCVSASECWAVGYHFNGSVYQTLLQRWDGTSWAIVISPNTVITQNHFLYGVTCASASECWAVGSYFDGSADQTLIVRWDGTSWTIVTSPNTLAQQSNFLYGVTCVSTSDCWAIGYYFIGSAVQTLIQRWDGTAWAIVSSPNTLAGQRNFLLDVTCMSTSECWAVGYYVKGSVVQTLIQRWDGSAWAIVSSPNTLPEQSNFLLGVTCGPASECWAVGYYFNGSAHQTLIERWDGTAWAIVSSPNTSSTQTNRLLGVTCVSASDCWAVGYYFNGETLVLRYTGNPLPIPTNVVSRKTHGIAGIFDVDLPSAGSPGIECRNGGANNDHQMILTFASPVTFESAAVTSGTGTVSSTTGSGTAAVTVNLTGVTNAQTITLTLSGVNDGTNTGDVGVRMSVLLGDTTASRSVNSSDIAQTKSQSGQSVTTSNFRQDATADGAINSSDISLVKSKSGTGLPQ